MDQAEDIGLWYRTHVLPNKSAYIAIAMRILGQACAAEDVVHDVIAELISDDRWKGIPEPQTYLGRSIYNRCINIWRRRRVVPFVPLPNFESAAFAYDQPTAIQIVEAREGLKMARMAIEQLPPKIRKVIILRIIENMTVQEISQRIGTSESVIHRHIKRGRALISQFMILNEEVKPSFNSYIKINNS